MNTLAKLNINAQLHKRLNTQCHVNMHRLFSILFAVLWVRFSCVIKTYNATSYRNFVLKNIRLPANGQMILHAH